MQNNDLISVIVPVYNVEKYLRKCIESIINQTYKNLEIILVDDGSTDASGKICDEYACIDNRIKVLHKENGGISSARNAGLNVSSGAFITFIDSDDYIEKDAYEYFYKNKVINGIVAYGIVDEGKYSEELTDIIEFNNIEAIEAYINLQLDVYNYKVKTMHNITSSFNNKLFDKNLFLQLRFPEGFINEDNMIIIELLFAAKSVKSLPKNKYFYVKHLGSITQQGFNKRSFDLIKSRLRQEQQILIYVPQIINKVKILTLLACDNILVKLSTLSIKERKNYKLEISKIINIISERKDSFVFLNFRSKIKIKLFFLNQNLFFFIFYIRLIFVTFFKKLLYNN